MISENIITDIVKRACRNFNSLNFQQFLIFMIDIIEYLQFLVLSKEDLSSTEKFPSNGFLVHL